MKEWAQFRSNGGRWANCGWDDTPTISDAAVKIVRRRIQCPHKEYRWHPDMFKDLVGCADK